MGNFVNMLTMQLTSSEMEIWSTTLTFLFGHESNFLVVRVTTTMPSHARTVLQCTQTHGITCKIIFFDTSHATTTAPCVTIHKLLFWQLNGGICHYKMSSFHSCSGCRGPTRFTHALILSRTKGWQSTWSTNTVSWSLLSPWLLLSRFQAGMSTDFLIVVFFASACPSWWSLWMPLKSLGWQVWWISCKDTPENWLCPKTRERGGIWSFCFLINSLPDAAQQETVAELTIDLKFHCHSHDKPSFQLSHRAAWLALLCMWVHAMIFQPACKMLLMLFLLFFTCFVEFLHPILKWGFGIFICLLPIIRCQDWWSFATTSHPQNNEDDDGNQRMKVIHPDCVNRPIHLMMANVPPGFDCTAAAAKKIMHQLIALTAWSPN